MGFQYSNPTSTTCAAAGSHGTSPGPIGTHPGPKKDGVFHHHLAPPASQAQRNQPLPPTRRLHQICAFSPWLLPLLLFASSFVPLRLRGRRSGALPRRNEPTSPLRASHPSSHKQKPPDRWLEGSGGSADQPHVLCGLGIWLPLRAESYLQIRREGWENRPLVAAPCGQSCRSSGKRQSGVKQGSPGRTVRPGDPA